MFGRTRKHTQALEELREEFSAADRHARAVLTDAMAQIELRIAREREDRDATRVSIEAAVERTQSTLSAQAMDIGLLLQQVADTCALVAERVEEDRLERRAFSEAIGRLMQSLGAPVEAGERPIGGTVFPTPEIASYTEVPVDAEDADPSAQPVAEAPAPEEIIDLRTHEDSPREPRPVPRWAMKRN